MLCDTSEHERADFLVFVKGKHVIVPTFTLKDAMRACLPLEPPADATERTEHAS